MIERATAAELLRQAKNGRTGPLIISCEAPSGDLEELFCKFSAGCDQGVINLAREAIAVCLAGDLGLPVPRPYFVEVSTDFVSTIRDEAIAKKIAASSPLAFGSTRCPNQFSAWATGTPISTALRPLAAASLFFDGIIQNPDRRYGNPNCLVKGDEIRLIDHELAFAHAVILLWQAPWITGGMQNLANGDGKHIFFDGLTKKEVDWGKIKTAWSALSDARLNEYVHAIPAEWATANADVQSAIKLIQDARDNIDGCLEEVRRILA